MDDLDKLRYPVGRLERSKTPLETATRAAHLQTIEELPARVRSLVAGLTESQLDTPYRPGGWTIRQVVHHLPDSHLNAYVRMKRALTEDTPAIMTYQEDRWAELPEAKSGAVELSLALLDGLHGRWIACLRALPEGDLTKAFVHPEWGRVPVDEAIAMYAWHCRHHTAHIKQALAAA
jgi:hypothetical protein